MARKRVEDRLGLHKWEEIMLTALANLSVLLLGSGLFAYMTGKASIQEIGFAALIGFYGIIGVGAIAYKREKGIKTTLGILIVGVVITLGLAFVWFLGKYQDRQEGLTA
jgi:hypothetical protein